MDLFENYDINGSEDSGSKIIFKLSPKTQLGDICPFCGSKKYYVHTSRTVKFKDLPKQGKHTELHITYKRKRCAECKKTSPQPMPLMSPTYQFSNRLESYLKSKIFNTKFSDLSLETGINEGAIRYLFNNYCNVLDTKYNFIIPNVVLLYEVRIVRKTRLLLVNPDRCSIIDLLTHPTEKKIDDVLSPDTKYVCLTTYNRDLFLELICYAFNSALKTTDLGYKAKLTARSLFMKELLTDEEIKAFSSFAWSKKNPILYAINLTKNKILNDVYTATSSSDAIEKLLIVFENMPDNQRTYFEKTFNHIRAYGQYAFAWIDNKSLNSTVSCITYKDSIARALEQMPKAFGIETVRAKVLFNEDCHDIENGYNYGTSMKLLPNSLLSPN